MQASKIMPGSLYAVWNDTGSMLQRFHVTEVVTRRTQSTGSPHDYNSHVLGYVFHADLPAGEQEGERKLMKLAPDKLLGPFDQHAELVARQKAEREAQNRERQEREEQQRLDIALLYDLIGEEMPKNWKDNYKIMFRASHDGGVDVNGDALRKLSDRLRVITAKSSA